MPFSIYFRSIRCLIRGVYLLIYSYELPEVLILFTMNSSD